MFIWTYQVSIYVENGISTFKYEENDENLVIMCTKQIKAARWLIERKKN